MTVKPSYNTASGLLLCGLFYDVVNISASNDDVISDQRIVKVVEGSGHVVVLTLWPWNWTFK